VDYDGDGKLDLLLGDFCTYLHIKKDMTAKERSAFAAAQKEQDTAAKHLRDSMDDLRARFKKLMKGVPSSEWNTPENTAKWTKMYRELQESPPYKKHMAEYERLQRDLLKYVDRTRTSRIDRPDPDVPHGFVWFFRRK
jgi:hypothetical protein